MVAWNGRGDRLTEFCAREVHAWTLGFCESANCKSGIETGSGVRRRKKFEAESRRDFDELSDFDFPANAPELAGGRKNSGGVLIWNPRSQESEHGRGPESADSWIHGFEIQNRTLPEFLIVGLAARSVLSWPTIVSASA